MENKKRPVFLDLTRIDMPVMAVLSVAHRITGIVMFLSIPAAIYLLGLSLSSPQGYETVTSLFDSGLFRLVLLIALWCFAHHFFAGIRYFMLDLDIGVDVVNGRKSAWCVLGAGLVVTVIGMVVML
ncbi:MAG TPA: succinate dehydrogenase, cytochrome b556 subunit [Chromatiales bacterium]|nr:succinate dehydrogenase, cytochrome b556 subunit [Chromatiales bacterium]